MIKQALLSPAFFGPVQYFAHLSGGKAVIEQHGNYSRQTYRNRCIILGANDRLTLSVPVEKGKHHNKPDKEVRIAYHTPWQKLHWRSIVSAYNSSPFFQFYQDDLYPLFTKRYSFLFDLNMEATRLMMELTGLESDFSLTGSYMIESPDPGILDLREVIHPKKASTALDPYYRSVVYKQVFDQRHGFVPNLSILDLLFNKGPESFLILEESLLKAPQTSMPSQ